MSARIQVRRGTALQWTTANPVLLTGEPGLETDTGKQKVGDGATAWTSLPYQAAVLDVASGAAKLGSDGTVGGPGGSALVSSLGNLSSAYSGNSGTPFGNLVSSENKIDLCRPPYSCVPGADISAALQQAITDYVLPGSATELFLSRKGSYLLSGAVQTGNVTRSDKTAGVFTVTIATPAVFSKTSHGFTAGNALTFSTDGALPTGLTAGTVYYVIQAGWNANAFQVSTVPHGAAVATSGSQSGNHTVTPVVAWAGQIVFPSITWAQAAAYVCLRGAASPNEYGAPAYGTILTSNATTGNAFSVAAPGSGSYPAHSNIAIDLASHSLKLPTNTQAGGFDFTNAWQWSATRVSVTGAGAASTLTGAATAFGHSNDVVGGAPVVRDCQIASMPVAFWNAEHLLLEGDVFVTNCGLVVGGHNSASAYFGRLYAMGCLTMFAPDSGLSVAGQVAIELTGQTSVLFANDASANLKGELSVFLSGSTATSPSSLPAIIGGSGSAANSLSIKTSTGLGAGTLGSHPVDRFKRKMIAPAPPAGYPGLASETWHPTRVSSGSWNLDTVAGKLSLNTGDGFAYYPAKNGINGGESRTITVPISAGPAAAVQILAQVPNGGTNGGKAISAYVNSGLVTLKVNNVARGTTPAASFPNSSTHTVTLSITVQYGAAQRARVAIDGVQTIDYWLTPAEQAIFMAGTTWPYIEDGLRVISETVSTFNSFIVQPLADDALVSTGTATLVAGTVDVANTNVTANTIVRLNRQAAGGTLGELSVALVAATKFTINSNNAADTSTVYYEVVSY